MIDGAIVDGAMEYASSSSASSSLSWGVSSASAPALDDSYTVGSIELERELR